MFRFPFSKRFSHKRSAVWGGEIEVQEVLLDSFVKESMGEDSHDRRVEVPLSARSMKILYGAFFALATVFLGQTAYLQVVLSANLSALAQSNAVRSIPLASDRGVIYDRFMRQLAFNEPSFDFVCDRARMPQGPQNLEDMVNIASDIFHAPAGDMRVVLQDPFSSRVVLAEDLTHEELVVAKTRAADLQGCEARESTKRVYEDGPLFSQVIGYTSKVSLEEIKIRPEYSAIDQTGKTGIEKTYEKYLRGVPGKILVERDSLGAILREVDEVPSEQGKSAVLWLDAGLQTQIGAAFEKVFHATGAKKGAAVALDPRTGGVLALISFPGFDNNLFSGGISKDNWELLSKDPSRSMFNRAISGIGYPTGSVIKPLVGAAALEEGVIQEDTRIFAPLELCVQNQYTKEDECFRDWIFHGTSDIQRAIAESVNTFFYIIGGGKDGFEGLGPEKIKEYIEKFGWGKKTGIDIPGEGEGILPEFDKNWRLGDTYHLSIGQGPFAVTPLQVASAFSAVANGGTIYVPHAVQRLVDEKRNTIETIEPQGHDVAGLDPRVLKIIREGMRQTVTAGSATGWLDGLPAQAAVKTGTAQTGRKTPDGRDFLYSWTVSFAPYENPEIVFVAVVEDIQEGQVGALPITKDVLEWYFSKRSK